jgi:hypothetical protein
MWAKIFLLFSERYKFAYFLVNVRKGAKNKEISALSEFFPQVYPQKPWTACLLPSTADRCSQRGESMQQRHR